MGGGLRQEKWKLNLEYHIVTESKEVLKGIRREVCERDPGDPLKESHGQSWNDLRTNEVELKFNQKCKYTQIHIYTNK